MRDNAYQHVRYKTETNETFSGRHSVNRSPLVLARTYGYIVTVPVPLSLSVGPQPKDTHSLQGDRHFL